MITYVLCVMLDQKKPWRTCSFRAHLVNDDGDSYTLWELNVMSLYMIVEALRDFKARFIKEILMILGWAIWWHRNDVTFYGACHSP
jgi:hypothetical protein